MLAALNLADIDRRPGDAAIGVDVGGTKTALGLVDAASLTLLATTVIPTAPGRGGEAVLGDIEKHVSKLGSTASELGRDVVGIGVVVPEIVNLAGQITSSAVIPGWNESPVASVLSGIAPTVVEADVRAAAFAEAALGAGRDYAYHVFLTVGTGISYCAVVGGRPFAGAHGGALNIGTSVLAVAPLEAGPDGQEVVLEHIASGSALVRRYVERGGNAQRAEDVLAAARAGDQAAIDVVDTGARALGIGMALLINLLDPQAVVVGGGLGSAGTEYWPAAKRWARRYSHAHASQVVLAQGELGPDAGVIGAGLAGLLAGHAQRTSSLRLGGTNCESSTQQL
jgi:glucokinase